MGIYFAKCLLDKYLIDMPLSLAFLKLLCTKSKYDEIWYDGILDINDLISIEPSRGNFFRKLLQIIDKRNQILNNEYKTYEEKRLECQSLKVEIDYHDPVDIEHLWFVVIFYVSKFNISI